MHISRNQNINDDFGLINTSNDSYTWSCTRAVKCIFIVRPMTSCPTSRLLAICVFNQLPDIQTFASHNDWFLLQFGRYNVFFDTGKSHITIDIFMRNHTEKKKCWYKCRSLWLEYCQIFSWTSATLDQLYWTISQISTIYCVNDFCGWGLIGLNEMFPYYP